jgi:hypothetical protein
VNLKEYSRAQQGAGILSTADALIRVDPEDAVPAGGFQRVRTWRPGT